MITTTRHAHGRVDSLQRSAMLPLAHEFGAQAGSGNYKCKLCGAWHSGGANMLCPDCKTKGGKL